MTAQVPTFYEVEYMAPTILIISLEACELFCIPLGFRKHFVASTP